MPATFTRSDWEARPAGRGPGPLFGANVVGIALHWPAMTKPLTTIAAVMAALRSWQAFHMDKHGWSDIGYQRAYDQAGNRYILRDLDTQSGANGDTDVNERYGALLLILAPGETPSPAMLATVREDIVEHRRLFHRSTQIVGHGQIRPEPTACPGPIAQRMIDEGAFEPVPKRPSTKPTRKAITVAVKLARKAGRTKAADRLRKIRDGLRP